MEYYYKFEDKRYTTHTVNNTRELRGSCYGLIRDTVTGKERRVDGSEIFGLCPVNAIVKESRTSITVRGVGCRKELIVGLDVVETGVFKLTLTMATVGRGESVGTSLPRHREVLDAITFNGYSRLLEIKALSVDMSGCTLLDISMAGRLGRIAFVPGNYMPRADCVGNLNIHVFGAL